MYSKTESLLKGIESFPAMILRKYFLLLQLGYKVPSVVFCLGAKQY